MKKLITLSLVLVMLFAFVACDGEAGGKTNGGGNGGSGELTPAEQAIMNKYGEDTFYLAELASTAGSYSDLILDICGAASDQARQSAVTKWSQFGFQISNATAKTLTVEYNEMAGDSFTLIVTNVAIKPSAAAAEVIDFDVDFTVVSKEGTLKAVMSIEVDLVNGYTKIVKATFRGTTYATNSQATDKVNQCIQEIDALDENGNGGNNGGQGGQQGQGGSQGQGGAGQDQGESETWTDGTDSLSKTAYQILTTMEGMNFEVTIRKAMGMAGLNYYFVYGRLDDNQVWAKRYDEYPAQFQQEPQYDMIAMDRIPGHQFEDPYEHVLSDYIYYESDAYSNAWAAPDTGIYHEDDGSRDWHEAVVFWLYGDEDIFSEAYATENPNADYLGDIFEHYALMLKPYTPYNLQLANGKYKVQAGKKTVAGLTCTVYQYQNYYYYISDLYGLCVKESYLDGNGSEVATFEVTNFTTSPTWPVRQ